MFKEYTHIERLEKEAVEGILAGKCHIFPKLDGTNGSIWIRPDGTLTCGSRNRELCSLSDNLDFCNGYLKENKERYSFLTKFPNFIIYGEYLKKHTINNYKDDAWNKFYIFDIYDLYLHSYLKYEEYKTILDAHNLEYIPTMEIIENPTMDQLNKLKDENYFLMKDGFIGEGIVIKNYDFRNKFGRECYGKIVANDPKKFRTKKIIKGQYIDEIEFTEKYVTKESINKLLAKLKEAKEETPKSTLIPKLLTTIYYDLIREDLYDFTKKGNRVLNFRYLNQRVINKVKELTPELF